MTHDLLSGWPAGVEFEFFMKCRACSRTTIWAVRALQQHVNPMNLIPVNEVIDGRVDIVGIVRPRAQAAEAPEHTPAELKLIFDEGAQCLAIGAWNASSAMFRKIVDQISKDRMNAAPIGVPADKRTRFNLKPRLAWLFANNLLPKEIEAIADAIREDANDGVHNQPLGEADALDLQDFTIELLEALYTLPGRLKDAEARRAERRK
jgi:hypothetical protein